MRRLAGAVCLIVGLGCGGDGNGGSASDAGSGNDGAIAVDGGGCTDDCPVLCGRPDGECPGCQLCRHDHESVTEGNADRVALFVGDEIDIAYYADGQVRTARRLGGDSFDDQPVGAFNEPTGVDIATDDTGGIRWILAVEAFGSVSVFWSDGGEWVEEPIPMTSVVAAAIDVDNNGQPILALNGTYDGNAGLFVATRAVDWTIEHVEDVGIGAVAIDAAGEIHIAWRDVAGQRVGYAVSTANGFVTEVVEPEAAVPTVPIVDIAVDGQGQPHLAYTRDSRYVDYAVRQGGQWATREVSASWSDADVGIAVPTTGTAHVGYKEPYRGEAIAIADIASGLMGRQAIDNDCTDQIGSVSLASDATGGLHVAYLCGGDVIYSSRTGSVYPQGYWTTCQSAANDLCARACECGACCLEEGGSNYCTSPESSCRADALGGLCGDASQDPSLIDACALAAGQAACGVDGAVVPTECEDLFYGAN